ncbi:MAG: hypothetical protein LLF94_04835 [Chlamydiales bacterium]|nr:hypothetical protein [Chlamydiales bacterium]
MLTVHASKSFLDKALLQALFYSLLFHLVLFGTFRIRFNDYQENTPQMLPLNVAIDAEPITEAKVIDAEDVSHKTFLATIPESEYKAMNLALLNPPSKYELETTHLPPNSLTAFSDADIADLAPKSTWAAKMYPLQLKLSHDLKKLTLLEDGSKNFRDKGPYESLGRFALTSNHLPIEYKVTVDGATGHIIRHEREQVLLDKRLQACADKLIDEITFEPFSENQITGRITLVFCCSGDEIKGFLK